MNSDIYTKFILTVIAVCLVILVFQTLKSPILKAEQGEQVVKVDLVSLGGEPLKPSGYSTLGKYPPFTKTGIPVYIVEEE
jgi:hypothetical protein